MGNSLTLHGVALNTKRWYSPYSSNRHFQFYCSGNHVKFSFVLKPLFNLLPNPDHNFQNERGCETFEL